MKTLLFLLIIVTMILSSCNNSSILPAQQSFPHINNSVYPIDSVINGRKIIDIKKEVGYSLYSVVYIEKGDTFGLDFLTPREYEQWFGYLPPETVPRKL